MRTHQLYRDRALGISGALLLAGVIFAMPGCAAVTALGQLIQPPRFEQAEQPAELRLMGPSLRHPAGGAESVIPLDLTISFADLPGLANVVRRAVSGQPIGFQLDGTVGIDAGRFGQPTFGPMLLVRGEIQ
jgi:hypothetical protein